MTLTLPDRPDALWSRPETLASAAPIGDDRHDVVVVGAGLVGLTTALLALDKGLRPVVVERHRVGSGTSGRSTAKVSALQGARTSQISRRHGEDTATLHWQANEAGLYRVRRLCADMGVEYQVRDAWTYTADSALVPRLDAEVEAARTAGVPVERAEPSELPFPTVGAIRLPEQLQLDPQQYLHALAHAVRAGGGTVIEGAGAVGLERGAGGVRLADGTSVSGDWVVLATLLPFPLRSLLFATSKPVRSYLIAVELDEARETLPQGMYLSLDTPVRSLRSVPAENGERLLIGGNSHPTGRTHPALAHVEDLASWADTHFGVRRVTHRWSAQDYQTADLLPHVGSLPTLHPRVLVATGFGKWGFTSGTAAAEVLAARMADEAPPAWADIWAPRLVGSPRSMVSVAQTNVEVGAALARGWAHAASAPPQMRRDAEGTVQRDGLAPVAVSRVDGVERRRSAICPHLGGIVTWNDAENTWDCPLHGSRFAPDGTPLCAPATQGLARKDPDAVT